MGKKQLALTIRRMRKERAWTQIQLAEVAGISVRTLQRLEASGNCAPETLMALANAFDIEVQELSSILLSSEVSPQPLSDHQNTTPMELPENPSFAQKTIVWGSALYLATVALIVLIVLIFFPEPAYPLVIDGQESFSGVQYRKFIQQTAIVLAIMLGFWAGFSGALKQSWFFGLIVLGLGVLVSLSAYSLLPWIQYPNDQYSPGAIWLFVGLAPLVVSWALVNIGFRVLEKW